MRLAFLVLGLVCGSMAHADEGYKTLFRTTKGIPVADQISIYRELELKLAKDSKQFTFTPLDGACPPAPYKVETPDLNKDGVPEVVVAGGDDCSWGVMGQSVFIFVKSSGRYRKNFGEACGEWHALPERSKGYSDLSVYKYGHCDEVLRWNGEKYAHFKYVPGFKGGCDLLDHK